MIQQNSAAPIQIHNLIAAAEPWRPATSAMGSRAAGIASRQTVDYMRSEFGGRSSINDAHSISMMRRQIT